MQARPLLHRIAQKEHGNGDRWLGLGVRVHGSTMALQLAPVAIPGYQNIQQAAMGAWASLEALGLLRRKRNA